MRLSALTPFFDIPASMERGQVGFAAWRGLLWPVAFGSAWGDESTPPRGVERGQVGSAA